jgi:elongation factor Ts
MVELKCETDFVARNEQFIELAKNLAMQIAATNPVAVDENGVNAELIERERAVYREKALAEGKPENIVEKIVDGAIKKYYKEVCLLEQPFIRDDKKVIRDLLNDTIATLGENITVGRFCRFQLGA